MILKQILFYIFNFVELLIIARVLLSFIIMGDRGNIKNPVTQFIYSVSDIILMPFEQITDPLTRRIGLDFSPLLALLLFNFLGSLLMRI